MVASATPCAIQILAILVIDGKIGHKTYLNQFHVQLNIVQPRQLSVGYVEHNGGKL